MVKISDKKHITKTGVVKRNPPKMIKKSMQEVYDEIISTLKQHSSGRTYDTEVTDTEIIGGLRDWGSWHREANDDGDYEEDDDFEVLDDEWYKKVSVIYSSFMKRYPYYSIEIGPGEKNWIDVSVSKK